MDQLSTYYDKQIREDLLSKVLNYDLLSTKIKQLVLDSDFDNEFTNKLADATETFSTVISVNGNYIYRVRITDNQGTILNKAFISGSI